MADEAAGLTDRVQALDRYAFALRSCGQYKEAVERYQEALKLEEETASGTDSISVARALNELALSFFRGKPAATKSRYHSAVLWPVLKKDWGRSIPMWRRPAAISPWFCATGQCAEAEPFGSAAHCRSMKKLGGQNILTWRWSVPISLRFAQHRPLR